MATVKQVQSKLVAILTNDKTGKLTTDKIIAALAGKGRLGNPINSKEVGDKFPVTLTGKIEIRDFNGTYGAYYLTKEGISIRVNASYDPNKHKENAELTGICVLLPKNEEQGIMRDVKFCQLVD